MASTEPSSSLADRVQSLRLPPPASGSTGSSLFPWVLSALLTAAVAYLLFIGNPLKPSDSSLTAGSTDSSATATRTDSKDDRATSDTATLPASNGEIVLESKGYIIPEQQILVSPQVSGRILELNFEAGQRVEKGFVLAVLESTEYLAEYERINASLESAQQNLAELREGNRPDEIKQAKAELSEAQTNLAQAEKDFIRKKDLLDKRIIQPQDYELAESNYLALVKRVEKLAASTQLVVDGPRTERKRMAEAQVRQIEAELRRAKWRLDNCIITSPIDGIILKKNAELGNLVNPVAFNGSFSLCDVADLSKLEVELSIQERDISRVFKGQRCKVRAEAFPKRVYNGVVSRLMPIADRAKGAVPVRVRLTVPADEEGVYLKPEMGATVQFYAAAPESSVAEPSVSPLPATNPSTTKPEDSRESSTEESKAPIPDDSSSQ